MTRVSLVGVGKVYSGNVEAVADLNLEIPSGQLLALIGPSGCGKTTLLRMIAGLERLTSGEIRFGEVRMNDVPPQARNTAMVFQDEALQPHLDVKGNLEFGLKLRRRWPWSRRSAKTNTANNEHSFHHGEITDRVNRAAATLGIGHLLNRLPRQLSGGERRRVALGQAMVRSPDVLLLDEPLSNLDADRRSELRAVIKELHRQLAVTTIYVTHDQAEAMSLGDRIAVMAAGKLLQVGLPLEVYDHPVNRTVARSLGNPSMNIVEGRLEPGSGKPRFVGDGLSVELTDARTALPDGNIRHNVALGIRPEHIRVQTVDAAPHNVDSLANITMVETLGDSTILRLRMEKCDSSSTSLTCKHPGRWAGTENQQVSVTVDSKHCVLFDGASGNNLTSGK